LLCPAIGPSVVSEGDGSADRLKTSSKLDKRGASLLNAEMRHLRFCCPLLCLLLAAASTTAGDQDVEVFHSTLMYYWVILAKRTHFVRDLWPSRLWELDAGWHVSEPRAPSSALHRAARPHLLEAKQRRYAISCVSNRSRFLENVDALNRAAAPRRAGVQAQAKGL
jgi:hypothetical protein